MLIVTPPPCQRARQYLANERPSRCVSCPPVSGGRWFPPPFFAPFEPHPHDPVKTRFRIWQPRRLMTASEITRLGYLDQAKTALMPKTGAFSNQPSLYPLFPFVMTTPMSTIYIYLKKVALPDGGQELKKASISIYLQAPNNDPALLFGSCKATEHFSMGNRPLSDQRHP